MRTRPSSKQTYSFLVSKELCLLLKQLVNWLLRFLCPHDACSQFFPCFHLHFKFTFLQGILIN